MSKRINRNNHARRMTNAKPAPKPATGSKAVPERQKFELFHENGIFFARFYSPVGELVEQYTVPCAAEEAASMRAHFLSVMTAHGLDPVLTELRSRKELATNRRNDGHDKTRPTKK